MIVSQAARPPEPAQPAAASENDPDPEQTPRMTAFARALLMGQKALQETTASLARQLCTSQRHVARCLRGIGESVMVAQHSSLQQFLSYLSLLADGGHLRRRLFIHHIRHDETQRVIVGRFPDGETQEQRGKIHVIQHEWIAVTETTSTNTLEPSETRVFKGSFSPMIRLTQNATAESIAEVLQQTDPIPVGDSGVDGFEAKIRVFETDECGANLKAQSILENGPRDGGDDSVPWMHLATVCVGHKCHTVALKTWMHFDQLHQGLCKSLRMLRMPGVWPKFVEVTVELALDVDIIVGPVVLEDVAVAHRQAVLELFSPKEHLKPKWFGRVTSLAEQLFNGDWRRPDRVEHRCASINCCSSRAETLKKIKVFLPKMLKALCLRPLDTDDWSQWDHAMYLPGLLAHMHRLLQRSLDRLFANELAPALHVADTIPGGVANEDQQAGQRPIEGVSEIADLAKEARVARAFWGRSDCARQIYLCQACLAPQAKMIREFLQSTSVKLDYQRMMQMITGGSQEH